MAYEIPMTGTILPAKENTDVQNPGPVHSPYGNYEWLQAQAQDTAWRNNEILLEEWHNAEKDSPAYAERLGEAPSWAVVVIDAEAGGIAFDQQKQGPPVSTLEA